MCVAEVWCCEEGFFVDHVQARDGRCACGDDCCVGFEDAGCLDVGSAGVLFCG